MTRLWAEQKNTERPYWASLPAIEDRLGSSPGNRLRTLSHPERSQSQSGCLECLYWDHPLILDTVATPQPEAKVLALG